jgi:hypothetical protein
MNIPNFENIKFVDNNGYITTEWQFILQQLFTLLQKNLSDEGYLIPQQPTSVITTLQTQFAANPTPSAFFGDLLYDSTTNQAKINIAGTFKVITVT